MKKYADIAKKKVKESQQSQRLFFGDTQKTVTIPDDLECHNVTDNGVDVEQTIDKTIPLFPTEVVDYPERPKVAVYAVESMNHKVYLKE